jgi:site-specific DNA-methyltransferase (adenine-specific)
MNKAIIHKGDCLPFMKTLGDESVDCIVSDPPYGTNFKSDIYDDTKAVVECLIPKWYQEMYRVLREGRYCFLFCGILNINVWIDEALKCGFTYKNILATRSFNRGSASAKGNFVFEFQPIIVLCKGKGIQFNKVDFFPQSEEWKKDKRNKHPSDFTYAYSNWIPSEVTYGTDTFGGGEYVSDFHPNAKSVKLEKFLIEIATGKGDIVLDPFLGSGTTGVAALHTGRDFIGCELNDKWYESSRRRISECNPLFSDVKEV